MRKNKILSMCLLAFATAVLFFTGCRLEITVPEGGKVITKSGAYECASGQVCTIDIYDIFFDEEFIASPAQGFRFTRWKKKKFSFCGNKMTPCLVDSSYSDRHPNLMKILESDMVFYLEPVFIIEGPGTTFSGLTSQQLPIALTVYENEITRVDFTYQQLGEIPPDPECRHEISVDLSTPINDEGTFAVEVSVPPQTSDFGKLRLVAFDGRLSGSLGEFEARGGWDFTELEILCEKNTGKTLRNFCGERFLACINEIDFRFDAMRED